MKKILFGVMLAMGSVALVSCGSKMDRAIDEYEDCVEDFVKASKKLEQAAKDIKNLEKEKEMSVEQEDRMKEIRKKMY